MIFRNILLQMLSHQCPALAAVVEVQYANELLQMIVEHCVVHPGVDIIKVWGDDRVTFDEVNVGASCLLEGGRMNPNTTKIADDEALQLFGLGVKTSHTILRVTLKSDAIVDDRRQKCSEKDIQEPATTVKGR
jgi:hypothetical protein